MCTVMPPFPCVWTVTLFQERYCMFPISSFRVQIELAICRQFLAIPYGNEKHTSFTNGYISHKLNPAGYQLTTVSKSFSRYSSVWESL